MRLAGRMIAAIVNDIAAAVMTEKMTPMKLPAGVAMSTAKMLPGDAGARSPEPKITLTKRAVIPPRKWMACCRMHPIPR